MDKQGLTAYSKFMCIVHLGDDENISLVGGKGSHLSRLVKNGFNVPRGFVITTDAFKNHLKSLNINPVNSSDFNILQRQITDTPLDTHLISQVASELNNVSMPLAVRSSATVEDGSCDAYAGQFYTALNVNSFEDLLAAIKLCWASLYSNESQIYTATRGHISENIEMAVVVQEMAPAKRAGVAFAVDPTCNVNDIAVVEWVDGLGDKLVSGESIDGRAYINKTSACVLRIDCFNPQDPYPDKFFNGLLNLLKGTAGLFGAEQDIEWSWDGTNIHLLQARPITTIIDTKNGNVLVNEWDLPGIPHTGWTEDHREFFDLWDEYNERIIFPLDYDLFRRTFWQCSVSMLSEDNDAPPVDSFVRLIHGVPVAIDPACRIFNDTHPINVQGITAGRPLEELMRICNQEFSDYVAGSWQVSHLNNKELLTKVLSCAKTYEMVGTLRLMSMHRWITGTEHGIEKIKELTNKSSEELDLLIEALSLGIDHETAKMNNALDKLREQSGMLSIGDLTQDSAFKEFMDKYGHFQINGVFLREKPMAVFSLVRHNPSEKSNERNYKDIINDALPSDSDTNTKAQFDTAVSEYQAWIKLREDSKTIQDKPACMYRELALVLGQRLAGDGTLEAGKDIFLLRHDELVDLICNNQPINRHSLEVRKNVLAWKSEHNWLPQSLFDDDNNMDSKANCFLGTGASIGQTKGRVRIVTSLDDFGKVKSGDIVVTRATNPAWTQLFCRIAGIVVENGSKLSHAAITAREFKIPAIVGLRHATEIFQDDELIHINGSNGEVHRIE
jgi:phosphohistidine swiveling domain-containing protein